MVRNRADSRAAANESGLWSLPVPARRALDAGTRSAETACFRAIVEHDPDAVVILDAGLGLAYANPVARATFDIPDHLAAWQFRAAVRRFHQEDLARLKASTASDQAASTDTRIQMPDGSWRWFALSVQDLRRDPAVNGLLVKLRDIDAFKRSEAAAQDTISALQRQNQNKSLFLSTVSHEFRTPLTSIVGYSEYLASNAAHPEMVAEDAEVIHREATRLSRLVDDVLLMDRVDNGHITLNLRPLEVNALVSGVAEAMRPLLSRHRLVVKLTPRLPNVQADRDRLAQALTNLISNAVKFSDHGGAITLETAATGGEVVISVHDEGVGIAPVDLERIFQRFERVGTGSAGRTVGTGLGLAIVSEIAHLHHGRVWVTSTVGDGSTFCLALPAAPE
ncbi:MAG: hypothetical protein KC442_14225 [Thermomicrobiales bacterium]|nr:hypothetical protein [Thermomicrobiales bacterium]